MIELFPGDSSISLKDEFYFKINGSKDYYDSESYLMLSSNFPQYIKKENEWYKPNQTPKETYQLTPATLKVYFPQYSVDTFKKDTTYMLTAYTYIHGKKIQLGCFEFKRKDCLACPPIKFGGMNEYYEYMDFKIADPFSIHFEDESVDIRRQLGEPDRTNNTGSILYLCIDVVDYVDDHYIKNEEWNNCQNGIQITDSDILRLETKYDPDTNFLNMNIFYNKTYGNDFVDYIYETYGVSNTALVWEYVIMDNNDIYYEENSVTYMSKNNEYSFHYDFDMSFESGAYDSDEGAVPLGGVFKSFDDWKPGMYINSSVSFYERKEFDGTDNSIPFITLLSNRIPITQEMFAEIIRDYSFPSKIDLTNLNMDNITINTFNQISQETIIVPKPNDSTKNHIMQPIFYQTRSLNETIIHPAVSENICINLDSYKSLVKRFILQVEGVTFKEAGRTNKGVIFKVIGSSLPKNSNEGTLYVLDQDLNLVTSGKYTYAY
jgi:hypothetical protein